MIIGISGKMQSGKNTVASIIQYLTSDKFKGINSNTFDRYKSMNYELYKNGFLGNTIWQQKAFAGKLKQIVSILTGIPVEDLEKQEVKDRVLGEKWWYFDSISGRIPYRNTLDTDIKLIKPTVRQLLQEIGTDAMRNVIHPNIWVNALFTDYKSIGGYYTENSKVGIHFKDEKGNITESIFRDSPELDVDKRTYPNWIITDMRFPNELKAVKDRGGITIRVNRRKYQQGGFLNKNIYASAVGLEEFDKAIKQELNIKEHASETALDNAEFDYVIENNGSIEELIEKVKEILIKEKVLCT